MVPAKQQRQSRRAGRQQRRMLRHGVILQRPWKNENGRSDWIQTDTNLPCLPSGVKVAGISQWLRRLRIIG